MPAYIQARARYVRALEVPPFGLYHEAFGGFSAAEHAHAGLQVLIPLAGRMALRTATGERWLGPEAAAIVAPGVPHAFTFLQGELEFLAIEAPADWVAVPAQGAVVVREPLLWLQARQLAAEVDRPLNGADALCRAGLAQVALYLARAQAASQPEAAVPDPRMLRAVDRILRDHATLERVEDLAGELAMSPRHFERCFKQAVGVAPRAFLIDVRVGAAKALLETSRMSVAEVGRAVGFKNPSHFSDTFARVVGRSPGAYRRGAR